MVNAPTSSITLLPAPSPNHDERGAAPIDILLLHYTGMQSGAEALERLRDPAAKVSAHYLIEEDGRIFQLVEEERRAWHAGRSHWAGERDINAHSVGIELVNPGHEFGYRPFPEPQMASLIALSGAILARHAIPTSRVLGHSDVAPSRKQDPGELFDWPRLARAGIGLWPSDAIDIDPTPDPEVIKAQLGRVGYEVEETPLDLVITAFQRHFRPEAVTGAIDPGTTGRLARLLRLLDGAPS